MNPECPNCNSQFSVMRFLDYYGMVWECVECGSLFDGKRKSMTPTREELESFKEVWKSDEET